LEPLVARTGKAFCAGFFKVSGILVQGVMKVGNEVGDMMKGL
jgi:hypothetical protein